MRFERRDWPPTNWWRPQATQPGVVERSDHARHRRPPSRSIQRPSRLSSVGAGPDRGIDHVGQPDVAGERRRAVDLGRQVEPRQRLADQAVLDAAAHRQIVGQLLAGRRLAQARRRRAFGRRRGRSRRRCRASPSRHPSARPRPSSARPGRPPRPRASARSNARIEVDPPVSITGVAASHIRCAAPARRIACERRPVRRGLLGEQTVGVERADRRRLDRHRPPVRAELVGEDLRQARPDAPGRARPAARRRSPGRHRRS